MVNRWVVVGAIVLFRILNAVWLSTFFQPDEYFQAFEPAHIKVYGYGVLTWEWKFGLRGCVVPVIYSYLFRLSELIGVDLILVCRVFQGIIAALGDIYTYKLAKRLEGSKVAKIALYASLGSAFYYFCGTRPFSNTFEMVFTTIALYYWPWKFEGYGNLILSSLLAHFAIVMRPTNALLWLTLGLKLLWDTPKRWFGISVVSVLLALAVHGADFLLDNWYYGFDVWPLKAFISTNIGDKASHHYGVMPAHFYFSSAIPMLLVGYLPVTIYGISKGGLLVWIVLSQITVYSFLAHKEFRFIFYLLPLLHIIFAKAVVRKGLNKLLWVFIGVNSIIGLYLGHVHQRGVLDVAEYIRNSEIENITFLMPCHSIPGYAHFHRDRPLILNTLNCDPPVVVAAEERDTYVDEADQFYLDPKGFLVAHPEKLTPHIAVFEALNDVPEGYHEVARFFNSHFHDDWRREGDVIIYSKDLADDSEKVWA